MSAQREGRRDLISSLPDEILGKILSLLWTNRAACTSVLSKRWRNLLALVDNLDLHDASGNHRYFCDFVDKTLALLSNSTTVKSFSLDCAFEHDASRVDSWIRTVLARGFLELHLNTADPMMYGDFISGCPALEELFLHYDDDNQHPVWGGEVSSPSLKRLTIYHNWPNHREEAHDGCCFITPSLEYLEYSSYVAEKYEVDLGSLVEARLDLRSWERAIGKDDEDESDDESDDERDDESDGTELIFGDVTDLVAGISNLKTLHLSCDSLEVFHLCCDTMPVFHNLLTLSFETDKERGWQVVPLLLNNSPNLDNLIIKGLVHQVTDSCGDACCCIPKKKKNMEKGVCCLSTCGVKVLHISGYRGTCKELKQMRHFLANFRCLETVKVGVKLNHQQDNDPRNRVTNALRKLPRVSSNSRIHFF